MSIYIWCVQVYLLIIRHNAHVADVNNKSVMLWLELHPLSLHYYCIFIVISLSLSLSHASHIFLQSMAYVAIWKAARKTLFPPKQSGRHTTSSHWDTCLRIFVSGTSYSYFYMLITQHPPSRVWVTLKPEYCLLSGNWHSGLHWKVVIQTVTHRPPFSNHQSGRQSLIDHHTVTISLADCYS